MGSGFLALAALVRRRWLAGGAGETAVLLSIGYIAGPEFGAGLLHAACSAREGMDCVPCNSWPLARWRRLAGRAGEATILNAVVNVLGPELGSRLLGMAHSASERKYFAFIDTAL